MSNIVYIWLWSNIWDKLGNINLALEKLQDIWKLTKVSNIIKTKAWWLENQEDFMNGVCEIVTDLTPFDLLKWLTKIEKQMWRERRQKWWPRNIDLDIIAFNKEIINKQNLIIPHKYAHLRDFVMDPLKELNEWIWEWILDLSNSK